MENGFKGKKILLVGGAQGFGASLAERLLAQGADIHIMDLSPLREDIVRAKLQKVDLRDLSATITALEAITAQGQLDGLVYLTRGRERYPLSDHSMVRLKADFQLNLDMFLEIITHATHQQALAKHASVVTVSSVCGDLVGSESLSYHASKAALESATKYLAVNIGNGVRVNCVRLGFIVKDEHQEKFQSAGNRAYREWAEGVHPLARVGSNEDIIGPIRFLLSSESRFITGQTLTIDGGLSLQEQSFLVGKKLGVI